MLQLLEADERAAGGRLAGRINQKPHLLHPWMDRLVRHPAILDAVEDVLGPNLFCWGSQFFIKDARDQAYVSWHQDGTYWGLSSPDVVTAWVALTPSLPENGCMRVVPGTHLRQVPHAGHLRGKQPAQPRPGDRRRGARRPRRWTSSCSPARCRCTTC